MRKGGNWVVARGRDDLPFLLVRFGLGLTGVAFGIL